MRLFIYILLLLAPLKALSVEQYNVEYLGITDDISNENINQTLVTTKGCLIVATRDGLNLYDGVSVEVLSDKTGSRLQLPDNNIRSIGEDSEQRIWICTKKGLTILDRDYSTLINPATLGIDTTVSQKVNCLVSRLKGSNKLLLLAGRQIYIYDNYQLRTWNHAKLPKYIEPEQMFYSARDNKVYLNILASRKIFTVDQAGNLDTLYFLQPQKSNAAICKIITDYYGDTITVLLNPKTPDDLLQTLIIDKNYINNNRSIWLADCLPEWKAVISHILANFTPSKKHFSLLNIYVDANGSRYFSTSNGLFKVKKILIQFQQYPFSNDRSVRGISMDQQQNIYIGGYGPLMKYNLTSNQLVTYPKIKLVWQLNPVANNRFILAQEKNQGVNAIYPENPEGIGVSTSDFNSIYTGFIHCLTPVKNGFLFYSIIKQQLQYIDADKGEIISVSNNESNTTPLRHVFAVHHSPSHGVWIGGDKGLKWMQIDTAQMTIIRDLSAEIPELLRSSSITGIYESSNQHIWFCTSDRGLFDFDPVSKTCKQYTTIHGLPTNTLYSITASHHDSVIWIGTQNGLSRFDTNKRNFYNFYVSDGLSNNEFNTAAIYRAADSLIFIGGVNGINSFNPKKIVLPNISGNVYTIINIYKNIKHENRKIYMSDGDTLIVDPDEDFFQIHFRSDLTWHSTEGIRYMIEGLYDDWQYTTVSENISFGNLQPGNYLITFQLANQRGNWGKRCTIYIQIKPHWYETKLFFWGMIMLAFLALSAFYYWKTLQLIDKFEYRKQIADNLHDDLGSRFYLIKVTINAILKSNKYDDAIKEKLEYVNTLSSDTLQHLRDFIWISDPKNDLVQDLFDRLHDYTDNYIRPVVADLNVQVTNSVPDKKVRPRIKYHLLRLYQEILTNIIKHTKIKTLSIHFIHQDDSIEILVRSEHDGLTYNNEDSTNRGKNSLASRLNAIHGTISEHNEDGIQITHIKIK